MTNTQLLILFLSGLWLMAGLMWACAVNDQPQKTADDTIKMVAILTFLAGLAWFVIHAP